MLTYRLVEKYGCHGAVYTTRETKNNLVVTQLFFQAFHRVVDERVGRPVTLASTDAQCEVGQHLRAFLGVEHFRMELHCIGILTINLVGGILHVVGRSNNSRSFREFSDGIAMTHPYLRSLTHPFKQRRLLINHCQHGATIFTSNRSVDLTAKMMRNELRTIADAQQWQLPLNPFKINIRSLLIAYRERTSAENHTFNIQTNVGNLVVWMNFAINIQFTEATSDKLSHL